MKTVRDFTYLGDTVSAGGGCEAAVTARTRCGWVKLRECGKSLYGRRFPLTLKGVDHKNYVRPAILHGSEAWCLKQNDMEISQRTERSMVTAMCGVQQKDRKRTKELMFGLAEIIDEFTMSNVEEGRCSCAKEEGWSCLGKDIRP